MSVFTINDRIYTVDKGPKAAVVRTGDCVVSIIVHSDWEYSSVTINEAQGSSSRTRSGIVSLRGVAERVCDYLDLDVAFDNPEIAGLVKYLNYWIEQVTAASKPEGRIPQVGPSPCNSCVNGHHKLCEGPDANCSCNCRFLPDPSGRYPIIRELKNSIYRIIVTGPMVGQFRIEVWDEGVWQTFLVNGSGDLEVREFAEDACHELARLLIAKGNQ